MNLSKQYLRLFGGLLLLMIVAYFGKYALQNQANRFHANTQIEKQKKETVEKTFHSDRAEADFKMLRNPKTNSIPRLAPTQAYKAAIREMDATSKSRSNLTLPTVTIEEKGPTNYGGRVRALDFDKRNPLIGLSGGVSGGIFRTTNGGASWTDVTPPGQIHNLTTIAQDKSTGNEDIWYAGGGEQDGNSAGLKTGGTGGIPAYYGNGVWKSTDNGLTWTPLASTTSVLETGVSHWDYVHRIIINPTNGHVYAGNAGGVYRSTDQGNSWVQVLAATLDPATITEIIRTTDGTYYAAISRVGIYKSTSGDLNSWTQIADGTTLGIEVGRIVLAFAPSNNNIIYALYQGGVVNCNGTTSDAHLRRWDNAANGGNGAWTGNYDTAIGKCANTNLPIDLQGGYNLALGVRPNNPNEVFIGGDILLRFTIIDASTGTSAFAGGDQGAPTATNLHVDQHLAIFTDNNTLWMTNDGGIRRTDVSSTPTPYNPMTDTGGFNWTIRNQGLVTYQYYHAAITPTASSTMVGGGAQDNANSLIPSNSTNATELNFGGDGIQFAIISGTSLTDFKAIFSTQGGNLIRQSVPGNSNGFISPNGAGQGFLTYFLLDGDNTEYLYYPSNSSSTSTTTALFRTRIASTFDSTFTDNSSTGWEQIALNGIGTNIGNDISILEVSRNVGYNNNAYTTSDINRKLYIGTTTGQVYLTQDPAFAAPLNLTTITPNGIQAGSYVSDIAVNPTDDKQVLLTYSNYGISSIYHTMDATANPVVWTEVEGPAAGAVAKASIRSAMITDGGNNTTLYMVGTSTGLYGTTTFNGANTVWERIGSTEIAFAVCVDMRLRTADNKIVVASHGNGLFLLTVPMSSPSCVATLALDANPIVTGTYQTSNTITSAGTVAAGTSVTMDAKNSVTLNPNFTAATNSTFLAKIGGCMAAMVTDADNFEEISKLIATDSKAPSTDLEFSLYPSPASGEVTIDLYLEQPAETVITLHSTTGNMVKIIRSRSNLVSGNQQFTFNAANLADGMYYVVMSTPQMRKSQKLMVRRN